MAVPNSQHRLIVGSTIDPVWFRYLQSLDAKASAADIEAIATALGSPDGTVANIPEQSADTVRILQGAGIAVTRDDAGAYAIALRPLGDSGAGTFKLITRDSTGRISGSLDGTAADVPYDNATSGLTAVDAQAAIDELSAEKLDDAPSDGNTYGRKDGAWSATTGGSYPEGISNPSSPSIDDKFYRTDLNLLIYYDGTRWLTVQQYEATPATFDALAGSGLNAVGYGRWPISSDYGVYIERFIATTYVTTTNTGSAFWTVTFSTQAGATATSRATFNTTTDSPNTDTKHDQALSLALAAGAATSAIAVCTKTGAPGGIYPQFAMRYRLIVT